MENSLGILLFWLLKDCLAVNVANLMSFCNGRIWWMTWVPLHFGEGCNQAALGWPWWACPSLGHHPQPCTVFGKHLASQQLHTSKMSLPVALTGVILAAPLQGLLQAFLTTFQLPQHTGWPSGRSPVRKSLTQQFPKVGLAAAASPKRKMLEIKKIHRPQGLCLGPSNLCSKKPPVGSWCTLEFRPKPKCEWHSQPHSRSLTSFLPVGWPGWVENNRADNSQWFFCCIW